MADLPRITALEFLSAVYCAAQPADALAHEELLDILHARCGQPAGVRRGWPVFAPRG